MSELVTCICTYKRVHLLALLLHDLNQQSLQTDLIVIVDGYPQSGDVQSLIRKQPISSNLRLCYIPSNHANLAYQRYLGWRAAKEFNAKVLLFLDDDLRLSDARSLENVVKPIRDPNSEVVGCTANITMAPLLKNKCEAVLVDRQRDDCQIFSLLARRFGSSRKLPPGGLSPSGQRRMPENRGNDYEEVEWLRGGVMACRMIALTEKCFSRDLFALCELGYGHGEDTLLSRRLASKGKLQLAFNAPFLHPNADPPKAYVTKAFRMGFGIAYSRRLLNDNYRGGRPPTICDRMALVQNYTGTACLKLLQGLYTLCSYRFVYAWGYLCGAVMGLVSRPSSNRLTPSVDWTADADVALKDMILFAVHK